MLGGDNVPPLVKIGLTDLTKSGGHVPSRPPCLQRACVRSMESMLFGNFCQRKPKNPPWINTVNCFVNQNQGMYVFAIQVENLLVIKFEFSSSSGFLTSMLIKFELSSSSGLLTSMLIESCRGRTIFFNGFSRI